jgi:hypothetical protein
MRSVSCVVILAAALLLTPSALTQTAPPCTNDVRGVFWGGAEWLELGTALAADPSPCAEYSVTIPPTIADRKELRARARFNEMRALGITPVAEINWTHTTGWKAWVDELPERTFYEAGQMARRMMAMRGLDVTAGETWAFNELTPEVLEDAPGARSEVLEFLRGLYDGDPGMPKARGIVFNLFIPSNAREDDVATYKEKLKAWLADEAFWSELDRYVDVFANEVYVSALNWGVSGMTLQKRAKRMNDYFQHMATLVADAPKSVQAARAFLQRAYLPLANALWPHTIGDTNLLDRGQMLQFLSAQTYALREYAEGHPRVVPPDLVGFGWAPVGGTQVDWKAMAARLANALHLSTAAEPKDACGPISDRLWCESVETVPPAQFNLAWRAFDSWE